MNFPVSLIALAGGLAVATPAVAQQNAPGARSPTVIVPGAGQAFNQAPAPAQTPTPGVTQGGGSPAQPQVNTPVFPPVENTVPGSEGAIVFPPAESITGVGGAGQTVFPPVEQTVPGAPGGFPFTEPNLPGGVQQNLQQGAVAGTGVGTTTTGTNLGTGTVNPFFNTLNQNQLFTQPGQGAPGQAGSLIQPPATQDVFLGGDLNQGFSVGPLRSGGGVVTSTLPAVPQGLGPGSRPGDAAWIGAELEPFDADEPDALDFSRSP